MKLSHKDLVKLGRYEAEHGYSLKKIEADFSKKGIDKTDTIKALEEVDYYNKLEQSKIQKESGKKLASEGKPNAQNKQEANKKKSSFWFWLVLLAIIGIILYLYFYGKINFDWLRSINFK
ncbi:hypothetical protein HYY71_04515 [Candidatus Woesearchaeota archaeon]|nr:hypothetical protein [Candidatus Woesearchaeota archaeon]